MQAPDIKRVKPQVKIQLKSNAMAGNPVFASDILELGVFFIAAIHGKLASGIKMAPARRVYRAGNIAC